MHTSAAYADDPHAAAFERERPRLLALAYRMTGMRADSEDLVQDAWLRWREVDLGSVASPGAYLTTVVTRLCLDYLKSARVRRETYKGPWLPEPIVEAAPADDAWTESLSMAFLVLLERLSPIERAVFLLREVFDYSYGEIAAAVDKSEANCRQMAKRAKEHLKAGRPRFTADPRAGADLVERFAVACGAGDIPALMELLAADVVVTTDGGGLAKAALRPIAGADPAARFLVGVIRKNWTPEHAVEMAVVNGGPGLLIRRNGVPESAIAFDIADGRIRAVFSVRNPEKLQRIAPA